MLLPLTGAAADLAISMERGARLDQAAGGRIISVHDTGETGEGAAAAATAAMSAGAPAILGPLFGPQVRSVASVVAGRLPIISFTNDPSLAATGAFVFGITASQSVSTILQYARSRGVRRVGIVGAESGWSRQAARAAERLKAEIGLETFLPGAGAEALQGAALLDGLRRATGGELPEAALLTGGGAEALAQAAVLREAEVQVLGTLQAADQAGADDPAMQGAWLSMPDPAAFRMFAQRFEQAHGGVPGAIAALAHDAASIAGRLGAANQLTRQGLTASPGFTGVSGAVRFREDGTCVRELAIVEVRGGAFVPVDRRAGV